VLHWASAFMALSSVRSARSFGTHCCVV
jgi:hypothetical protein